MSTGALLSGHRFVAENGVFDLDDERFSLTWDPPRSLVRGTPDARHAVTLEPSSLSVIDDALTMTSLPIASDVYEVAMAPDGATVVTLALGAGLERIDVATGNRVAFDVPGSHLLAVAQGGARAYLGTSSGVLAVDLASGESTPLGLDASIRSMAQSADGRWLAASTDAVDDRDPSPLVLFDTTRGTAAPPFTAVGPGAFTDEGRWLLWSDGTTFQATRTSAPSATPVSIAPELLPAGVFASPDGEVVVLAYGADLHVYCLPESSLHP